MEPASILRRTGDRFLRPSRNTFDYGPKRSSLSPLFPHFSFDDITYFRRRFAQQMGKPTLTPLIIGIHIFDLLC
jgi:hypothetical protein